MIRFLSITPFRTALDTMLKVKRGVYAGVTGLMNTFTTEFNSQQTVFHDIDNSLEVTSIH